MCLSLERIVIKTHSLSVLALNAKGGGVIHTSVASNLLCQMVNFRHSVHDANGFFVSDSDMAHKS